MGSTVPRVSDGENMEIPPAGGRINERPFSVRVSISRARVRALPNVIAVVIFSLIIAIS